MSSDPNKVNVGDRREVLFGFLDTVLQTYATPTKVFLSVLKPPYQIPEVHVWEGVDTAVIVKQVDGRFKGVITFDVAGEWVLRAQAVGNVVEASDDFTVIVQSTVHPNQTG